MSDGGPARTGDGWLVGDVSSFRFFADHAPPRPFGYAAMLRSEVRLGKTWLWWLATAAAFGIGALGHSVAIFAGVVVAGLYVWMLRSAVKGIRDVPFAIATITELDDAPGRGGMIMATARLDAERTVRVAVDRRLTERVVGGGGRLEVAILHKAGAGFSTVIGVRPVEASAGGPAGSAEG